MHIDFFSKKFINPKLGLMLFSITKKRKKKEKKKRRKWDEWKILTLKKKTFEHTHSVCDNDDSINYRCFICNS